MTKIYLETFGQGRPIVLVHGWAMHSGIWREFARQLALNYRVICVDLPGHGHSEAIDTFTLARISAELVKAIPEQSCCWLGWSLGATVALDMTARYPERVSSLILLAGNPAFVGATQWPGMDVLLLDAFADQLNENCQATLLRFLSLQIKGLPDQKACLKNFKTAVLECAEPDKNTLQSGLGVLKQADLRPVLSGLNMPVSVILGGLDALVPVAVGEKMQQLLPSLELNIIDRAGHVPFLSHSRETLAIISQFMDNHALG
ncbi:MAG: pimeloyl-ACP methyl ester esterase BioH [Methylobacter sp.]|nr:pimeloyl-ACP methyl ester esterase BioH [Methylobacter sp.]MDP2098963.1 pimeloyl-ACP methyl ester esterase BioH [Methylobacter sp.]MDP2427508.1 pimeloyl-ACP methyl ester esterase BioH [Methylobacter sp.]MDP3056793.1 pimeloyl-ACP methyl ester esterase BioH [Methylobacter sp.]MDP3364012.1 pimeloyl-ACP methyl ester esterase BioH [Methylobacter sp.]